VGFKLECSSATIRIIYHGIPSLDGYTYRKFGPVAPDFDGESQWYTLPGVTFGTVEIDDVTTAYAEFTLQDGQLGDDTGVEGIIIDQGGPAIESSAEIPTLNDWGLILLMILMGFFALHASKNRQRTNA
jgi:hypothetical protein